MNWPQKMCYQNGEQIWATMKTFSIRDLREHSGGLVREAEAGHLSIVAKHGRPLFVAVPMDERPPEGGDWRRPGAPPLRREKPSASARRPSSPSFPSKRSSRVWAPWVFRPSTIPPRNSMKSWPRSRTTIRETDGLRRLAADRDRQSLNASRTLHPSVVRWSATPTMTRAIPPTSARLGACRNTKNPMLAALAGSNERRSAKLARGRRAIAS